MVSDSCDGWNNHLACRLVDCGQDRFHRFESISNKGFFKALKASFKRNLAETYQLLRRDRYDRTNVRHLIGMTDRI